MKKLLLLMLALMLALPSAALADGVLADGWQDATLEELEEARAALDQQIAHLQAHEAAEPETTMTFTGRGLDVIYNITLPAGAWAYLVTLPEAATGNTTICEDGENFYDRHFTAYTHYVHAAYYRKETNIKFITMDYPAEWKLTIIKLPEVSSAAHTATGSGVSGFFLPASAQIINISTTASCDGYFSLEVLEANVWGTNPDGHVAAHGTLKKGATQEDTYMLTPDEEVYGYVWMMNCPDDYQWSITVK